MDAETFGVVAGWVLLGLLVVGVWVCARWARDGLGKLRVANRNRNAARAGAHSRAAAQGIGSLTLNVGAGGDAVGQLDRVAGLGDRERVQLLEQLLSWERGRTLAAAGWSAADYDDDDDGTRADYDDVDHYDRCPGADGVLGLRSGVCDAGTDWGSRDGRRDAVVLDGPGVCVGDASVTFEGGEGFR